ncbi:hypothetical protein B0H10DRAFT_2206719 [Mycena sp. CBHHK59/15]|nr:hypothetical protein B0H10DRAFT_2206719 [Mycena sp. CBHHK59/15]
MPSNSIRLHLQIDGQWRPFFDIPFIELVRFTLRPIKWLRYLGWCIYGQPGELSATPGGVQVTEDAELSVEYYYVSSLPPRFIDINAIDDRTSDSDHYTATFRQDLIDRDGLCIVTQALANDSAACHILPHSKGDEYISRISGLRADQGDFPVVEIGDVHNGVLLFTGLHRPFGAGKIAFLMTPNLYLLPDDIPSNALPPPPPDVPRLTLQHIIPQAGPIPLIAPHNKDARLSPTDMGPSAYLLHFFYTCAVLQRWGQLSRPYLEAKDIQAAYYVRESPYVSDSDKEESRSGRSRRSLARRDLPTSAGSRSFSDIMDQLLLLHSRVVPSEEPLRKREASGKVLAWLNE